jgi:hypothetical protein
MEIEERINAFIQLGTYIISYPESLATAVRQAGFYNNWFTEENCKKSLLAVAHEFLEKSKLETWISKYELPQSSKVVGIVAAGNIPLVSFHDILSVLISGHRLLLRLSDKDKKLTPHLLEKLIEIEPKFADAIIISDRWAKFDAVIATGSNNTGRYFEAYFGKYPHIIRKNRHSVAVLTGNETPEQLYELGKDMFDYFGLGCRNISQLLVPENYDFQSLSDALQPFIKLMEHNSYKNNLDYQRTLYMMNGVPFLNINFVNITENPALSSPVACIHFRKFSTTLELKEILNEMENELQCIVSIDPTISPLTLGQAQQPTLTDYADNIDTMQFLCGL